MMIKPINKEYATDIAFLHISSIPHGFISSLGSNFVATLYEAIAEDENSFGFVAVQDAQVLGFVAFSSQLSQLYKYVLFKKGFTFAGILIKKMLSLQTIRKVWANLLYPQKMEKMDLPDAELLSIAVAPSGRGRGLAKDLVVAGFQECRRRGIKQVKVLVAVDNIAANKLYQKCGFKHFSVINSHGVSSNIYIADHYCPVIS